MKVVFLSNFLNHHQLPFCLQMEKHLGKDFCFVQTEPVNRERLDMGYQEYSGVYDFLLCPYQSSEAKKKMEVAVDAADFVIIGSAPNSYIAKRLEQGKPVIRYSERFLRTQKWRYFTPKTLKFMYENHTKYKNAPVYVLCASAYTAHDYAVFGAYRGKTYKWGYLPEVKNYNIDALMEKKRDGRLTLLWAARFMKLKHPEKFLKCCARLKRDGVAFTANIIGSGDEKANMERFVQKHGLSDSVNFLGFIPPEKVRETMEASDIFMFNSDYRDGWGAVINEAMNSGCAVITSHAPGAGPYLIRHGENGLIYKNESFRDLYKNLRKVTDDIHYRENMGRSACRTMTEVWNAKSATENLIILLNALKKGETPDIKSGPCSAARPIPQWRMLKAIRKGEMI